MNIKHDFDMYANLYTFSNLNSKKSSAYDFTYVLLTHSLDVLLAPI